MTNATRYLSAILLTVSVPMAAQAQAKSKAPVKAHSHGEATLDMGIEGRTGTVEFRAPADDLLGFEHAPRTSAERATRDSVFAKLSTSADALVRFDASVGCKLASTAVRLVEEGGGHGDVRATYSLACRTAPAGRPISFGFSKVFPGVRSLKVQLVSDTAQVGVTIVNDRGSVRP